MEELILDVITKLGVSGFAIWILYVMHTKMIGTLEKKDSEFRKFAEETNKAHTALLERTISVINENTQAFREVMTHINNHKNKH